MFSKQGFEIEKRQARLEKAKASEGDYLFASSYSYYSDVANQWEDSYSNEKLLELFDSQSLPAFSQVEAKDWLAELSDEEVHFSRAFHSFYRKLATFLSSSSQAYSVEIDCLESLIDQRLLARCERPLRILEIGGGAGRNMFSSFAKNTPTDMQYVGVESIAMCYQVQNAVGSLLSIQDESITFKDFLDFKLARKDLPNITSSSGREAYLLPLWLSSHLPDDHFDLIICSHVLDELPPDDFEDVTALIKRTLRQSGVVYCRGSQHRAKLNDLFSLGGGAFHGIDITAAFLSCGLTPFSAEIVAGEFTRFFSYSKNLDSDAPLLDFTSDLELVKQLQTDFITRHLNSIKSNDLSLGIWGDAGFSYFNDLLAEQICDVEVVGHTHRFAYRDTQNYSDLKLINKETLLSKKPDVIVIAAQNPHSIIREIEEISGRNVDVKMFCHPIAFVYFK